MSKCPRSPALLVAGLGISSEDAEALQQQNAVLREALDAARQELLEVYKQASPGPGRSMGREDAGLRLLPR